MYHQVLFGIGTEDMENLGENEVRVELPDKKGYCVTYPQSRQLQIKAEQIGKIIGQYFTMQPALLSSAMDEEEREAKGEPDYLWLICKGERARGLLKKELESDFHIIQKQEDENCELYLLDGIEGKEH